VPSTLHVPISTGAKHNRVLFRLRREQQMGMQIVDSEKAPERPEGATPGGNRLRRSRRLDFQPTVQARHRVYRVGMSRCGIRTRKRTRVKRDFHRCNGETFRKECQEARQWRHLSSRQDEKGRCGVSSGQCPRRAAFLQPRRALRHALLERELRPDYYSASCSSLNSTPGCDALDIRDPFRLRRSVLHSGGHGANRL